MLKDTHLSNEKAAHCPSDPLTSVATSSLRGLKPTLAPQLGIITQSLLNSLPSEESSKMKSLLNPCHLPNQ